ncbi:MAG: S24 family peptidase [Cyanobacteriota bacterium]|nr:S24 family peptidase [Cyanobacteriota bacterium]
MATTGLNLHAALVPHPGQTLLLRVWGDSMVGAGISHGDLLVVERGQAPRHGQIVVACLQGAFTLKRLMRRPGGWMLEAAHPAWPALPLGDGSTWGVVRHVIHTLPAGR